MAKTRLDESRWPLVVYTAIGDQSDAEFEAYLADADRVLSRRERYGVIFDARRATPIGPKLRKRQVEWLRENDRRMRAQCVALGMLLTSPVQRGVFRAILWMNPLPFPYSVEVRFEAASRFVCQHLEQRGCVVPPAPRWDLWRPSAGDPWRPSAGDTWRPSAGDPWRPSAGDSWRPSAGDALRPSGSEALRPSAGEALRPAAGDQLFSPPGGRLRALGHR